MKHVCWFWLIIHVVWAQAPLPNDSLYHAMIRDYLTANPGPYLSLQGIPSASVSDTAQIDSQSHIRLTMLAPNIVYTPVVAKQYIRSVNLPYQWEDSSLHSAVLVYQDTVTRSELRRILRMSSLDLQGKDPRRWGQWGRATVIIGSSLLVTGLIFYVRSL